MNNTNGGAFWRSLSLLAAVVVAVALGHAPAQAYLPGPLTLHNGGTGARTLASARIPTYRTATASLDFPSLAAVGTTGASQKLTITVTGAAVGNAVLLGPPSDLDVGLNATGFVSATNTVTVQVDNVATAAVNPSAAPWRATVLQQ